MAEQRVAHIGHHALSDPSHIIKPDGRTRRQHGNHCKPDEEILVHQRNVGGVKTLIQHTAHRDGHNQCCGRSHYQCDQSEYRLLAIIAEKRCQP